MNKNFLNLEDSPPFSFLLYPAYRSNILISNDKSKLWFLSSFIQFSCTKTNKDFGIEFVSNPFFWEIEFKFKTKNFSQTLDRIIYCINKKTYISLTWNENMIPCRPHYDLPDYKHMVLIYGYDLNKELLYITGFNQNQIYSKTTVSFKEFREAYNYYEKSKWKFYVNKPWVRKRFSVKYFNKQLFWYKNAIYPIKNRIINSHSFLSNKIFGIETYNNLIVCIATEFTKKTEKLELLKALTAFAEHKRHISNGFTHIYFSNRNTMYKIFSQEYDSLYKEFLIAKNIYLKYINTDDENFLNDLIKKIKDLYNKEGAILEQYFKLIDK